MDIPAGKQAARLRLLLYRSPAEATGLELGSILPLMLAAGSYGQHGDRTMEKPSRYGKPRLEVVQPLASSENTLPVGCMEGCVVIHSCRKFYYSLC
jgi:hypothetical protein